MRNGVMKKCTRIIKREMHKLTGIKKLYPEGNAEARFRIRGVKRIFVYCNRDGLFYIDVKKAISVL